MTSRRGPRDDAGQRRLPAHRPGPWPSGTDAQRTPGGTAAEGADIPPLGTAQAQTGPKREKLARLGLIRDAPLVPLSCLVFPFRGGSLNPPPFPRFLRSGVCFPGFGGPPLLFGWGLHLGTRPPARVNHDDVEAPPPFPVWDDLPRGANRAPVDFA